MTVDLELDPAPAPVERIAGQPNDMEGIHDRDRVGDLFGSGLAAGEAVHRDDLHRGRVVGVHDVVCQDCTVGFEVLADDFESKVVESAELGQVRRAR